MQKINLRKKRLVKKAWGFYRCSACHALTKVCSHCEHCGVKHRFKK